MHPLIAEFLGTMLMILLGNGVVANVILNKTKGHGSGWIVITIGWALAVYVGVVIAGPYSGAHLNPAVTIALAIVGKFAWGKVAMFILAQLTGSVIGAVVVWIIYRDHFKVTDDPNAEMAVFCTAPAIHNRLFNL